MIICFTDWSIYLKHSWIIVKFAWLTLSIHHILETLSASHKKSMSQVKKITIFNYIFLSSSLDKDSRQKERSINIIREICPITKWILFNLIIYHHKISVNKQRYSHTGLSQLSSTKRISCSLTLIPDPHKSFSWSKYNRTKTNWNTKMFPFNKETIEKMTKQSHRRPSISLSNTYNILAWQINSALFTR